jgi:hypothetical protein
MTELGQDLAHEVLTAIMFLLVVEALEVCADQGIQTQWAEAEADLDGLEAEAKAGRDDYRLEATSLYNQAPTSTAVRTDVGGVARSDVGAETAKRAPRRNRTGAVRACRTTAVRGAWL